MSAAGLEAKAQPNASGQPPSAGPAQIADAAPPLQPVAGDRIMVLKQPWLDLALDGRKTLEVRGRQARLGWVWLANDSGFLLGRALIAAVLQLTEAEFMRRQKEHFWPDGVRVRYATMYGLELANPARLPTPIPHWREPARAGWHRFEDCGSRDRRFSRKRPLRLADGADADGAATSPERLAVADAPAS